MLPKMHQHIFPVGICSDKTEPDGISNIDTKSCKKVIPDSHVYMKTTQCQYTTQPQKM